MFDFYKILPKDWNIIALEDICLNKIPEKLTAEKEIFKSYATVLYCFFKFIQERNFLDTTELQKKIKAIDKNIYNNAINEKNWSNAKKFTMAAMEKGIALDNTPELYAFADEYNKNIEKNLKSEDKIDKRDFILECIYSKY